MARAICVQGKGANAWLKAESAFLSIVAEAERIAESQCAKFVKDGDLKSLKSHLESEWLEKAFPCVVSVEYPVSSTGVPTVQYPQPVPSSACVGRRTRFCIPSRSTATSTG